MRNATLVLLLALIFSVSAVQTHPLVAQEMPDVVLRAAQTLNAQYGSVVDLNNVVWDYRTYDQLEDATAQCPNLGQTLPPLPANTSVSVVELKPVHDGLWGDEIWLMLVYNDLSLITTCKLPPTPVPTSTPRPYMTAVPPTITPTPTNTPTPSHCAGVLASRLVIGQQGRVVANGMPNVLRSIPGSSGEYLGEIPAGGTFTVLNGPRCFSDYAWWQVNYNGVVGWTAESDSEDYWLEPATLTVIPTQTAISTAVMLAPSATAINTPIIPTPSPTATVVVCNPNAPSRLKVGQYAQVTPGYPNNIRANPGTSSAYVGEIQPQQPFLVLAGPECASSMAWWQVDYNGMIGWTPEGETTDDYWLEPLATLITPDNINQLTLASTLSLGTADQLSIVPNTPYQFTVIDTDSTLVYAAQFDTVGIMHWQPAPASESLPGQQIPNTAFTPVTAPMLIPVLDDQNRLLLSGYDNTPVITSETSPISAIATHPLGLWVVASMNGELRVWSGNGTPQTLNDTSQNDPVGLIHFSPDGSLLASTSSSSTFLWQTATWTIRLSTSQGAAPDTGQLALGMHTIAISDSSQPGVQLYDINTQAFVNLTTTNPIPALAFNPVNDLLVTADTTGQIQVWDSTTGDSIITLAAGNPIQQMAFSPDGDALFTLDQSGVVSVWLTKPQS